MSRWTPCKRRDFIRRLRALGFDGPLAGTRHSFMTYESHRLAIPSNTEYSRILRRPGTNDDGRSGSHPRPRGYRCRVELPVSSNPWEGKLWVEDLVIVDLLYRNQPVWGSLRSRLSALEELGVVEGIGRGRGVRHLLSQRFYSEIGRAGAYTREKGLDRQTNLALLLRHVEENAVSGARLQDLLDVLRHLSRDEVQGLLRELKDAGRVHVRGATKAGRWFPGRGDGEQ